jgi:F0F1-type ATP synthase assembly protein I
MSSKTHYTRRDYPLTKIERGCLVRKEKAAFRRFLQWQLLVVFALTVITWFVWGRHFALSVLAGGLLVVIPNIFLVIYLFIRVNSIYVGEALKIILTGLLLVLLLHYFSIALAPLLLGLLGTYTVYFFSRCFIR